jgi:hypothetical protein
MTTYDMRAGIAIDSQTETRSIDEMRFIKESWEGSPISCPFLFRNKRMSICVTNANKACCSIAIGDFPHALASRCKL